MPWWTARAAYPTGNWSRWWTERPAALAPPGPTGRRSCRPGRPNGAEFIAAFYALAQVGAACVPLRPNLRGREILGYTEDLGLSAVLVDEKSAEAWHPFRTRLRGGILRVEDVVDTGRTRPAADHDLRSEAPDWGVDRDVLYLSTSGSTGRPKIVPRTERNLAAGARNVQQALGIAEDNRFLAVVPFHHANGFSNYMILPLACGAATVTLGAFAPGAVAETIRREAVTVLIGSPFIFRVLAERGPGHAAFQSVRTCLSSGAPMSPELTARCEEHLGLEVRQLYGSTETGTIAVEPPTEGRRIAGGAAGRPVPGVDIRILRDDATNAPAGEPGEVAVRSGAVMRGYLGRNGETEGPDADGFFRTGDVGRIDTSGRLWLQGRKTRVLNVAGIKVDPVEIENVLESMPGIRSARVTASRARAGARPCVRRSNGTTPPSFPGARSWRSAGNGWQSTRSRAFSSLSPGRNATSWAKTQSNPVPC